MAKKLLKILKLQITGAQATPAPPLGPILSQAGVNIKDFTDKFNNQTKKFAGLKVNVVLKIYSDRSFDMTILGPTTTELIKKAAGIKKGASRPNIQTVGKITSAQLAEIAKTKMQSLNTTDIEAAKRIIAGTCRQMGVKIVD